MSYPTSIIAESISANLAENSYFEDGCDGGIISVHYVVSGLPPTPAETFLSRACQAVVVPKGMALATTWIPRIGEEIPNQTAWNSTNPGSLKNYRARRVRAQPFGNPPSTTDANVYVDFQNYNGVVIRHNGNVVRDTTRFDRLGNLILVKYLRGSQGWPTDPKAQTYPAEPPVFRPRDILEFERYEVGSQYDVHAQAAKARVNAKTWQGEPARTWMCIGVDGGPIDYLFRGPYRNSDNLPVPPPADGSDPKRMSTIYRRRWIFEFVGQATSTRIQDTWDPIVLFRDRSAITPPADINPLSDGFLTQQPDTKKGIWKRGNGWMNPQVPMDYDFSQFELPNAYWPFSVA